MAADIERSIVIPAPTDDVWAAISDPDRLGNWLGGTIDAVPHPGEPFSFDDGEARRRCVVTEVEPGRSFEFWWIVDGAAGGSVVRIELQPVESGTRVTVIERAAALEPSEPEPARRPVGFRPEPLAMAG